MKWLYNNGANLITIALLGLLWFSWRKKLAKLFELLDSNLDVKVIDSEKSIKDIREQVEELTELRTEYEKIVKERHDKFESDCHDRHKELINGCELKHASIMPKEEAFKTFISKENGSLLFANVEASIKNLADEIKGLRSDFKDMLNKLIDRK